MYWDLNDDDLQAYLLSESISSDAILAPEAEWQAAQAFRAEVRDRADAHRFEREVDDLSGIFD